MRNTLTLVVALMPAADAQRFPTPRLAAAWLRRRGRGRCSRRRAARRRACPRPRR
jgi:hypothetical protein